MTGRRRVEPEVGRKPLGAKVSLDASRLTLSRAEAIYALETVLLLNGVRIEPVEPDGFKAVAARKRE